MKYRTSLVTKATSRTLKLLHGLGSGVLTKALGEVGVAIVREWDRNIDTGRSRFHAFPALSPTYAAWKRKVAGARPILDLTGAMRASFRPAARHLGGPRYEVLVRSVGAASYGKRRVKNIDKARWAIEGAKGGKRKGRAAQTFGEAMGMETRAQAAARRSRKIGDHAAASGAVATKNWSRPPRVFTAIDPKVIARVLAAALRKAAR